MRCFIKARPFDILSISTIDVCLAAYPASSLHRLAESEQSKRLQPESHEIKTNFYLLMCHVEKAHTDLEDNDDDDPVIAEYDVFLTDSSIKRFLFQYPDRKPSFPYNSLLEQKPEELRIKPRTGLVEVDIPIDTTINYDGRKGAQYSEAMKKSRLVKGGGSYGMAGGFSEGPLPTLKMEDGGGASRRRSTIDIDMGEDVPLAVQTLGGRIVPTKDGDPIYMLGAFRGGLYSTLT